MISYDEAVDLVTSHLTSLPPVNVPLAEAGGKILAENIPAEFDLPPADCSAMDGYAFALSGLASSQGLREVGFVPAGSCYSEPVATGEAVRIMTGAPLPPGCDTVVPMEDVVVKDGLVQVPTPPPLGSNVRYRGEEIKTGATVLATGSQLYSGSIGLLAAAGRDHVSVYPAPRVAILSTGDELVELGEKPDSGKIVNSNALMLAARLREEGFLPELLGIARDNRHDLESRLRRGLACDLLITSGGISVGDHDYVQEMLTQLGFEKIFWKVAIKPGKPVLFGRIGTLPVFGLPGNPAASAATYELLVRPALRILAGYHDPLAPRLRVRLLEAVRGGGQRQQFIWGQLVIDNGELCLLPSRIRSSGQNRSLHGAQALLPVAIDSPDLAAGSHVEVILLRLPPGPLLQSAPC